MIQIKPCICCNRFPRAETLYSTNGLVCRWYFTCNTCGKNSYAKSSINTAIENWNYTANKQVDQVTKQDPRKTFYDWVQSLPRHVIPKATTNQNSWIAHQESKQLSEMLSKETHK
jgi:hypothetical protein